MTQPGRGVPLYLQLAAVIREQIARGELSPGEMVPGENQLRDDYHVSRVTAAKALDQLAIEGLIQRKPGLGSFVLDAPPAEVVQVGPAATVKVRMPQPGGEGWRPLLCVYRPGGAEECYDATSAVVVTITGWEALQLPDADRVAQIDAFFASLPAEDHQLIREVIARYADRE